MFSFIDSASDHAAALSHFHSYALFFLILVIVFVVWLLKMVLRFVVLEKDLHGSVNSTVPATLPHISYIFWFLLGLLPSNLIKQSALDVFSCALVTKNATKLYYSFSLAKTIYPDQGKTVNSFSMFPTLFSSTKSFRRLYPVGVLTNAYLSSYNEYLSSLFFVYRASLHNVPYLFPYERVEIASHGPYSSVEEYLTTNIYLSGFYLAFKHLARSKNFAPHVVIKRWNLVQLDVKNTLGFALTRSSFLYKSYSVYNLPFSIFINFYGTDSRMFFYLFFQHVRHRKILEWVWTCIPALILLLLLYPSLILLYCYDRPYITKPYLTFKAIGHQWYWSYEYSDFVTSSTDSTVGHINFDSYMIHQDDLEEGAFRLLEVDRRIVLPLGVCLRLITTSSDVLHSWAVPALGVKIDAVPGRLNQFWIVADRPGTFYGQCSELCGVNHGFMPIAVEGAPFLDFFKAVNAALAQ